MKKPLKIPHFMEHVWWAAIALMVFVPPAVHADPIIWTGPTTNFAQTDATSPPQADVLVPGKVSLTRNFSKGLYNTNVDAFAAPGLPTPSDTEWSFGALSDYATLTYQDFDSLRDQDLNSLLINGGPMVCHLINEDIYLSVQFTQWGKGGGLIAYTRSTPAVVAPPPTPTVSITAPETNAVFAEPANVSISANASVSTGSVTNVQFFAGANLLGSKQTAPFNFTANGLSAGSYALKAVATAGGISATSAPVTISVVAPVTTSLSAATATVNNQFVFSYSSTPGLRYEVDISSNLLNWIPVSTNVATGNPSFFTNPISGGGNYYRVGRLPNP
jgi:hypothetical protein